MNQAYRPVVYALALFLLSAALGLTGCASQQTSSPPPRPAAEPETAHEPQAAPPEHQAETHIPSPEPKAIPFEEVLKKDREAANRKQPQQPALPSKDDIPPHQASTPLRPSKETPEPKPEPEEKPETDDQQTVISVEPETIQFTLDQLPITIEQTWILASTQDNCSLQTVPVTMDDGAGQTPVSLRLSQEGWLIDTKSDIDLSYPNTGLFPSNGDHIPLESLVKDTKISILDKKQQLTDALKVSEEVRVALGFWPTWPVTKTQSQTISVAHFQQAYAAWKTCNQRISAR